MADPFLGSEALRDGLLTRHQLRSKYVAVHQDVYLEVGLELTPALRAKAAWLRSRRSGVLAGFSAATMHRTKWIGQNRPATIIDDNRRRTPGLTVWEEHLQPDEIVVIDGIPVTTPARTAVDLARHYPLHTAVAAIDALCQATQLKAADIELSAQRRVGHRDIRRARRAIELVDEGAQSPKETWLRLLLIRRGFPRPQTQIPVHDEYGQLIGVIDMGYEDIKVGLDYDGAHHRTAGQFDRDLKRAERIAELGWIHIRVTSEDTEATIIGRLERAFARRT